MDSLEIIRLIRRRRRRRLMLNNARNLRTLRDNSDPFHVTDEVFISKYRVNKRLTRELIEELRPMMNRGLRRSAIPVELKVLCALHFYAHGSSQRSVATDNSCSASQPSVSRCINEVTSALNNRGVLQRHIVFPRTRQERGDVICKNYNAFQIPGVLGFVDGTHVALKSPQIHEELYVNRKSYHSINVQIICESDLIILNVLARFPGSSHDSFIWRSSAAREEMVRNWENGDHCWLLGDSGYPQEPWLHTPILHVEEGSPEFVYTQKHCKARNTIERCIGVMKMRFRCIAKAHELQYSPEDTGYITTNAVSVLHNICVRARLPVPDDFEPEDDDDDEDQLELPEIIDNANLRDNRQNVLQEGQRVRDALVRRLAAQR